jgi:putative acetyltransferase
MVIRVSLYGSIFKRFGNIFSAKKNYKCKSTIVVPIMYRIRHYRSTDLQAVISSYESASKLAHPFLKNEFIAQVIEEIPEKYLPNADTWVAEVDGEVVGFISLMGDLIGALFLQPSYHGQGIGKALMDKAKELHTELELAVFTENYIGRRFYTQCGFRIVEERIHEETGQREMLLRFSSKDGEEN